MPKSFGIVVVYEQVFAWVATLLSVVLLSQRRALFCDCITDSFPRPASVVQHGCAADQSSHASVVILTTA